MSELRITPHVHRMTAKEIDMQAQKVRKKPRDDDEASATEPPDENPVLTAMTEYAEAVRGDWSNFDGRSEKSIIDGWVQDLRQPNPSHDIEWHRRDLGICMAGGGHWCGYWGHCDDECGCEPCAEDRSAR